MRSYATISPLCWTRGWAKRLRGNPEALIVATYLMTCQQSTMTGIYGLNLAALSAETGLPFEAAQKGLRLCAEKDVAYYDEDQELVWVPGLSEEQVGTSLGIGKNSKPDKRILGLLKALQPFAGHRFVADYLERYGAVYSLHHPTLEAALKPLLPRSPFQGAHVSDSDPDPDPPDPPEQVGRVDEPDLQSRAKRALRDPMGCTFDPPQDWLETRSVFECFQRVWGARPIEVRGGLNDPRLRVVLDRFAEGEPVERLQCAIKGSKRSEVIDGKREFQTLQTILRDAGQVEKFAGLLDDTPSGPRKAERWRPEEDDDDDEEGAPMPPEARRLLQKFGHR